MKHIYYILSLSTSMALAQIPAGYYDYATGSGYTLKTQLKKIIDDVNDGLSSEYLSVDNGYSGLYITYETSDVDSYYENDGTVLDMYSENPNGPDAYEYTYEIESPDDRDPGSGGTSEGEYYNREHLIPQSVFDSNSPMRNDAHFVVPSDKYVNAQRGNYPFGVVDAPNYTSSNGSKLGNNLNSDYSSGYTGTVFEPIDEFKGDIARMFFYFATRYEDAIASFNSYDMFDSTSDRVFTSTFFNILYQWHVQDPVSQRETDRNDAIFNRQNNRNPFIDHPEYVAEVWSSMLSSNHFAQLEIKLYPNPVRDSYLYVSTLQDLDVVIFDVLGKIIITEHLSPSKNKVDVSFLQKGLYLVQLSSEQGSVTKKILKQ